MHCGSVDQLVAIIRSLTNLSVSIVSDIRMSISFVLLTDKACKMSGIVYKEEKYVKSAKRLFIMLITTY